MYKDESESTRGHAPPGQWQRLSKTRLNEGDPYSTGNSYSLVM